MENRKIPPIVFIFIVIMLWIMNIPKVGDASDSLYQENLSGLGWRISDVREGRNEAFWKCDATLDTVYFCYFDGCYIDAYNVKGEYQYTITLNDSQNGGTSIYCTDDLLYAKSKSNDVFVFDGTNMLEKITYDEAMELGCYFMNLESEVYVSEDSVYRVLEDGRQEFLFALPEEVRKTMTYFDYGDIGTKNRIYVVVTFIPFLLVAALFIYNNIYNKKCNGSKGGDKL